METANGELTKVIPGTINRSLFEKLRKNSNEVNTQTFILQAFEKADTNPERYGTEFDILIPKKTWGAMSVDEMRTFATQMGGHLVDRFEIGLKWAQKISNAGGSDEVWRNVRDEPVAEDYNLIIDWEDDQVLSFKGHEFCFYAGPNSTFLKSRGIRYRLVCLNRHVPMVAIYNNR